jgi:hypothetical protein
MAKGVHASGYEYYMMVQNLGTIFVICVFSIFIIIFLPLC